MESSIDRFCETHDVPHERLIGMLNACLTHIGNNLLYEIHQNRCDASTQTDNPPSATVAAQTDTPAKDKANLESLGVGELRIVAKKLGRRGYSKMNKNALIGLIHKTV